VGLDAEIEISDKIDIKISIYILFKEWINTTKTLQTVQKCNLILIRVMVCLYPQLTHRRHRPICRRMVHRQQ
jgi:hypothetical protein